MSPRAKPLQILMVEDNRSMAAVFKEMLVHTGLNYGLTIAENGKDAIALAELEDFDCVLLDYELPDMNARDILRKLQPNENFTSPVIILTAHTWEKLATDVLSLGAIDFITKSECSPEILTRSIVYAISRRRYQADKKHHDQASISAQLESAAQEVNFLSNYDKLTNLPNRELFLNDLEKAISRAQRHKLLISLLYIDIDNFKQINDTYGHEQGDKVLVLVGHRLQAAIRKNDVLCRIGEDEFALYLDNTCADTDAAIVAEKIQCLLAAPIDLEGHDFYICCSIGIAHQSKQVANASMLITNAQTAMFAVKANGKNSFTYYSKEMTSRVIRRFYIEREIRKSLANNEFELLYQPKIDLASGQMAGAEALLRWRHPIDGYIGPGEFIPIAEESDLILEIDDWVFNKVVQQIKQWETEGLSVPVISFNVPSREFQRGDLCGKISASLQRYGVKGQQIELEVTERLLVEHNESNQRMMTKLKKQGVIISIDDFGTGYSSFSYLLQFPCDVIKIDKSFVDEIPKSHTHCMIVESIIILAHKLGLKAVAEGVENEAQYHFIKEAGCDQIQGYYFSRPVSVDSLREKVVAMNSPPDSVNSR